MVKRENNNRKRTYNPLDKKIKEKSYRKRFHSLKKEVTEDAYLREIRLNKYISNSGICSRRDADNLIKSGLINVNGKIVTELGAKVKFSDTVKYDGRIINPEKKIYLVLNKPKNYICTLDDPQKRNDVYQLVKNHGKERIFSIGRLDRNTTGVLLFTNDGFFSEKLTHPSSNIKKLYHVTLNKNLKQEDFNQIKEGIKLEDGYIKADDISYVEGKTKKEIGIEIHSGKNRIIRRIFEHLNYDVIKLDRVSFAGITKKNIKRGCWRFLDQKEINFLKML